MISEEKLNMFMHEARRWSNDEPGYFVAHVKLPPDYTLCECQVTAQELAARHPQLPDSLAAMIRYHEDHYGPSSTFGREVWDTLQVLNNRTIHFTDVLNKRKTVTDVSRLYIADDSEEVHIHCTTIEITRAPGFDEHCRFYHSAPFVERSGTGMEVVSFEALEESYPGWLQRFNVAKTLGMETHEVIDYVFFENAPAPVVPLPEITFE